MEIRNLKSFESLSVLSKAGYPNQFHSQLDSFPNQFHSQQDSFPNQFHSQLDSFPNQFIHN